MPGAILQLVANNGAPQNLWIDHNPQITFFKKVYRRHTPFAREFIPLKFKSDINFGDSGSVVLLPLGDLIHRIYFVFDIPKLAAMFLNTKSQDILKVINNAKNSDDALYQKLVKFVSADGIEVDQIMNIIDATIQNYQKEERIHTQILDICGSHKFTIDDDLSFGPTNAPIFNLDTESLDQDEHILEEKNFFDFDKLKFELTKLWVTKKKEYLLIYELLKLMYFIESPVAKHIPLRNNSNLVHQIIYENIFDKLIPNQEILFMHQIKKIQGKIFTETPRVI